MWDIHYRPRNETLCKEIIENTGYESNIVLASLIPMARCRGRLNTSV